MSSFFNSYLFTLSLMNGNDDILQKGELKTITNELTRVLKISRFADKFKFESNEKGCCGGVVEVCVKFNSFLAIISNI